MDITSYIENELFIIVPVLYACGMVFKKSDVIADKWIPIILGILGVALASVYKLAYYKPSDIAEILGILYAGITQGILCASASVYANNIFKQLKKDENEKANVRINKSNG